MACCLIEPSHYPNQYWLFISKVLWHSSEGIIQRKFWKIWLSITRLKISKIAIRFHRGGQWVTYIFLPNYFQTPHPKQVNMKISRLSRLDLLWFLNGLILRTTDLDIYSWIDHGYDNWHLLMEFYTQSCPNRICCFAYVTHGYVYTRRNGFCSIIEVAVYEVIVYTTHIKCILKGQWNRCSMKFNWWHVLYCVKVNFTITKFEPSLQKIIILIPLKILCIHESINIDSNPKPKEFVLILPQLIYDGQDAHLWKHLIPSQYKDLLSWYRDLHCKYETVVLSFIMGIPTLVRRKLYIIFYAAGIYSYSSIKNQNL